MLANYCNYMPEWNNIFKLYFIHRGFSPFQHKLHQNPNTYNEHRNGNKEGRSGCSDRDKSFGYDINDASM